MTSAVWELTLFGALDLRGPEAAAAESILVQPKHIALLSYLEVESCTGRSHSFFRRDHLIGVFWPELDQDHARAALRRVVHQVRRALGADIIVSRGDEELGLDAGQLRSDVRDFTACIRNGQLARALELYAGDLMQGFFLNNCIEFERWVAERRDALRQEAGACAWTMAQRLEADSQFSKAGLVARLAAHFSWDDERMLRKALDMLERLGDRSGALRLYGEFERRMQSDYGAKPSRETVELVKRLRGAGD